MALDKRNTFILSRNERKTEETHADFTGSLTDENGNEFWLNAWVKEKDGRRFFTGNMKPKDQRRDEPPQGRRGSMKDALDSDVPF